MKSLLLILLAFFVGSNLLCQTRLTIKYESTNSRDKTPGINHWTKQSILVIRDSVSYEYGFHTGMQGKMKLPLGSRFIGHSRYLDLRKNLLLFQSEPMNNPRYLVADTIENISWTLVNFEKKIMGYTCKKATGTKDNKKLAVFYTPDLPTSFGPAGVVGLPGTILEIWWGESLVPLTAIEISNEAADIVEPIHGKRIGREKFNNILRATFGEPVIK